MAKFDIQYAEATPQVIAPAAMRQTTGQYAALANAGRALAGLGQQLRHKEREEAKALAAQQAEEQKLKTYSETENGKIALSEFDAETDQQLQGITDPDQIQAISEQRLQQRSDLYADFATTEEAKTALDFYTRRTAVSEVEKLNALRYDRQQQASFVAFDKRYNQLAEQGQFEVMLDKAEQAFKVGVITDKEFTRRAEEIPKLQHDWDVEEIRGMTQAAVGDDGDKTKAYEIIDKAQKEGIITAEDNRLLGDSIDNFVAGRFSKAREAQYQVTVAAYDDFTQKIQSGDLTYEDIGTSGMLKADKEKWSEYIRNQYIPAPDTSTPEGFNTSADAAITFATLGLSKQEALDQVMQARYVDQTLDDQGFAWAIEKINNPYPKDFAPDLGATLKDNFQNHNRFFRSGSKDRKSAQNVNAMLLSWVDGQLAEGKKPTAKEMFARSEQFRKVAPTNYVVGSEITRGGRTFEVIDFDFDGEPIVEEVQ